MIKTSLAHKSIDIEGYTYVASCDFFNLPKTYVTEGNLTVPFTRMLIPEYILMSL